MSQIVTIDQLVSLSKKMRLNVLELAFKCDGPAHLGGALSIIEVLAVLYGEVLRHDPSNKCWDRRDRFILSKGHGVLAYYAALYQTGYFSKEILQTFKQNGSDLIAHPVMNMGLGIESSNGSLGHGLSMSVGIAWGLRQKNLDSRVYTLIGDGECDEGSVWEAAMSASRLRLDNLTAIIDCNGFQSDGPVAAGSDVDALRQKWVAQGWVVEVVAGHEVSDLLRVINKINLHAKLGQPRAVIALTEKGHGVSFMQQNNLWHHNRLTESLFEQAKKEIANG